MINSVPLRELVQFRSSHNENWTIIMNPHSVPGHAYILGRQNLECQHANPLLFLRVTLF